LIYFFNPNYMTGFLKDKSGQYMITVVLILQVLGIFVIRRIIRLRF